jgi:hypothetical protein
MSRVLLTLLLLGVVSGAVDPGWRVAVTSVRGNRVHVGALASGLRPAAQHVQCCPRVLHSRESDLGEKPNVSKEL